jgi:CRP-like cAMP-binding protein
LFFVGTGHAIWLSNSLREFGLIARRHELERSVNAHPDSWSLHNRLVRKLNATSGLTGDETQAILELPLVVREYRAAQDVVSIGEEPSQCAIILEGWACRYKMAFEGGRQIMSFHLAGDMVDAQSLFLKQMDHSVAGITPLRLALVQHRDLHDLLRTFPGIGTAITRDILVDAAIFREWLVGTGRRSAHQRIAHLLCAMATKARVVGLAYGDTYPWPVTQDEIADALGLSTVHVNRVISDLRLWGLVTFTRRTPSRLTGKA